MFNRIRRLFNQFFRNSRTINNEPINKVSLIVIILIDIFILINVFTGLDSISQWYLSPEQVYPCYQEWQSYRTQTNPGKDFDIVRTAFLDINIEPKSSLLKTYQAVETGHLGQVSTICLDYAQLKDGINNSENQKIVKSIEQKQRQINTLEDKNRTIRSQYDSSLLEKIAGQPREQSINVVGAEKAKIELDKNNRSIGILKQEITSLKNQLIAKPETSNFLDILQNQDKFTTVETGYKRSSFWYPTIQLGFQSLFLLPLITIALVVYRFSQTREYGLISLITWHLLVIFCIPLIIKLFEFLQIGAIFKFIFDIISAIFGGLLFLVSYVYILLIPLIGFAVIKFLQKIVFNPRLQAANRIQKSRCIRCAKKLHYNEAYCPHCGYYQYVECPNCHSLTYKYLPYCRECGATQNHRE
ncbi:hypothetical protein [Calothrix sp. NIES-3974]|uniref:hypothetical protein n=1 Tax=Calothrix sp. NIES-3974 TaxID=2005462 RepID=UPI000B5F6778|nr:hypothetical protein [Calothrix sp. NIES-3974]BAZ07296.1 hypothetical protein NIES3974_39590 [Calothrix sp. NIES-3974]